MSNAIEIEAKALVSKEEYERLVVKFSDYDSFIQKNYYVDSDDMSLRKEGLGLRIRYRGGHYDMTLKAPLSQGLLEKTARLTEEQFDLFEKVGVFPNNDIKHFLIMMDIEVEKLKILTSLTTKRTDIPYMGGKLSLDENEYNGVSDYEIELEFNNEADATNLLKGLLESENIKFALNKKPKAIRALDSRR